MDLDKNERSFVEEPIFVPLPLVNRLEPPRSKRADSSFMWIIGTVSAGIAFWFFTNKTFRDYTGLNMFITICIYSIVCVFIAYFFLTRFVFRIDKKVAERANTGSSNQDLALNQVWNISTGGLHEEEFFNHIQGLVINYQGCPALVYRTIMGSIDGLGVGADGIHYDCSQDMLDTIIKNRYSRLKINLKYDTENDEIWSYTSDRIYEVSREVGQNYVDIMSTILNYQYEYTKENSKVSSTYHIIKLNHDSTISDVTNLYHTLLNISKRGSVFNMKLVNLFEFQSLLQKYYGFQHIDFNSVMPKTALKETLGDSKVINISDASAVRFATSPTEVKIVDNFYDRPYVEVFDMPEDITITSPEIDIFKD